MHYSCPHHAGYTHCSDDITCELVSEWKTKVLAKAMFSVGGCCCCAAWFLQMNMMPIGHHSDYCDLSQTTLLPTKNCNLIIQTCVEAEHWVIKMYDKSGLVVDKKQTKKNPTNAALCFSRNMPMYMSQHSSCSVSICKGDLFFSGFFKGRWNVSRFGLHPY